MGAFLGLSASAVLLLGFHCMGDLLRVVVPTMELRNEEISLNEYLPTDKTEEGGADLPLGDREEFHRK